MRVRIDYDIFGPGSNESQKLDLLFLLNILIYKNRFRLVITDPDILESDSFRNMPPAVRSVLEESLTYSTIASESSCDCVVCKDGYKDIDGNSFSLDEAIRYLLQPLSVIVENSLNDANFLLAVFRSYDETNRLIAGYENGWVQFENAGGCGNVQNFIKSRIQLYGGKPKFLHCYVILDSDKRFPEDKVVKYGRLARYLDGLNVPYHILRKRSMENYLPDQAIQKVLCTRSNKEWIMAYMQLTDIQKDFFCISGGFRHDISGGDLKKLQRETLFRKYRNMKKKPALIRKYMQPEISAFYADVSDGNMKHLEGGLELHSFKETYPAAFQNTDYVYRKSLAERASHDGRPDELQQIKDEILKLL